ncbi:MAG: TonB-dependent receptor, partial [Flavisolibacter sp.]
MIQRIFFVSLSLFLFKNINAQTIQGEIVDQNSKPVPLVSIHILNTNINSISDASGHFAISGLYNGRYVIELSAIGFATQVKEITISKDGKNDFVFHLQSSLKQLDAITVTAEKREDLLQNTAASLTVLNAKQVEDLRLWEAKDLTAIVPNLSSGNSGDERNVTSIRGITTTSYDPAVVTYIDGVNQFTLDTYIGQLIDIERIEILRGPQGTLYGRNAMGGVINIITKQPGNNTEGFAEVNFGNYGQQRYSAAIRWPLIKNKLFLGASGIYDKSDGFYKNQFNNTHFDRHELFVGNYFLKFLPAADWSFILNAKHQNYKNNGAFPLVNGVDEAFNNPFNLNQNAVGQMIDNTLDLSFSIIHKGRNLNLSSQLAWQHNYRYYNAPLDGDFSPLDAVSIINNYGKPWNDVKALTHEFRFTSSPEMSTHLNWTAGTYFFHQNLPNRQATHFGADAGLLGIPDSNFSTINSTKASNTGISLYGQINFKLFKKWQLTTGLRYDYEYKKLDVEGEYQKDGQDPFVTRNDTSAAVHYNAISPKLAIRFEINDFTAMHVSYSRGYRTGGLTQLSSDPSQPPLYPYKPEYSNNIEWGIKNNSWNNRLILNIAAFLTYVNNAQVPTLILPDAITVTRNTGSLTSKGVEAEASFKPLKGLEVQYNFGYTHAEYSSLKLSSNGQSVDLEGKKQIFTPDITSMLSAQYSYDLIPNKHLQIIARAEWHYLGTEYFDLANNIRQSPYNLIHS